MSLTQSARASSAALPPMAEWGAIVGGFIMGVMNNGMSIIGWDVFLQQVSKGLVVLLAVAFDMWSKSKSKIK